jgi:flagellar motor switch protein FliM
VLDEFAAPLKTMLDLKVGDTLMLNATPESQVQLKCGTVGLSRGRVGRINHKVAVRVEQALQSATRAAIMKMR